MSINILCFNDISCPLSLSSFALEPKGANHTTKQLGESHNKRIEKEVRPSNQSARWQSCTSHFLWNNIHFHHKWTINLTAIKLFLRKMWKSFTSVSRVMWGVIDFFCVGLTLPLHIVSGLWVIAVKIHVTNLEHVGSDLWEMSWASVLQQKAWQAKVSVRVSRSCSQFRSRMSHNQEFFVFEIEFNPWLSH